jgi:hypothetical protein
VLVRLDCGVKGCEAGNIEDRAGELVLRVRGRGQGNWDSDPVPLRLDDPAAWPWLGACPQCRHGIRLDHQPVAMALTGAKKGPPCRRGMGPQRPVALLPDPRAAGRGSLRSDGHAGRLGAPPSEARGRQGPRRAWRPRPGRHRQQRHRVAAPRTGRRGRVTSGIDGREPFLLDAGGSGTGQPARGQGPGRVQPVGHPFDGDPPGIRVRVRRLCARLGAFRRWLPTPRRRTRAHPLIRNRTEDYRMTASPSGTPPPQQPRPQAKPPRLGTRPTPSSGTRPTAPPSWSRPHPPPMTMPCRGPLLTRPHNRPSSRAHRLRSTAPNATRPTRPDRTRLGRRRSLIHMRLSRSSGGGRVRDATLSTPQDPANLNLYTG